MWQTMTTLSDEKYFKVLEEDTAIVLVGENEDQWSSLAQTELRKANITFTFFSWSDLKEARKSGEWVRYPVLEHWKNGQLREAIVGFSQDKFRRFVQQFVRSESTTHER